MSFEALRDDSVSGQLAERDRRLIAILRDMVAGKLDHDFVSAEDDLSRAVAELLHKLRGSAQRDTDQIVQVCIRANETGIGVARLLSASKEVDSRSQSIAAAVEEMVSSVQAISQSSQQAAHDAAEVQDAASSGVAQVRQAVTKMNEIVSAVRETGRQVDGLSNASKEIGVIVQSIDAIAKQTRLLALNATIEAARAGDAGRGFAVVANEVKSLSQQTAAATEDIRKRIDGLREEMSAIVRSMAHGAQTAEAGQESINALGHEIEAVGSKVHSVTGRMSEIAGILQQQTLASNEVSEGVGAIANMVRNNLDQVENLANVMDQLEGSVAGQLGEVAKLEFDGKVVRLAKADHVMWKRRLVAMAAGRMKLNASELADHRSCRLGKWYYGDSVGHFRNQPAFRQLEEPHAEVHRFGKEAARLFAEGKTAEALEFIAKVEQSSEAVLQHLDHLAAGRGT